LFQCIDASFSDSCFSLDLEINQSDFSTVKDLENLHQQDDVLYTVQSFSSYEYKDDCDMNFLADFHEDNFADGADDNHIVGTFDIISDVSNSLCNDKVTAPNFDEDPSIFDEYSGHSEDHIFASSHIEFYNNPPLFNDSEGSDMEDSEDKFYLFLQR
jgi:hypothetical protein